MGGAKTLREAPGQATGWSEAEGCGGQQPAPGVGGSGLSKQPALAGGGGLGLAVDTGTLAVVQNRFGIHPS